MARRGRGGGQGRGRGRGRGSGASGARGTNGRRRATNREGSAGSAAGTLNPSVPQRLRLIVREPPPAANTNDPASDSPAPESTSTSTNMAPVKDPSDVDARLEEVIQHLFDVQSAVHGYLPETQGPLVEKIIDLTHSLSTLSTLTTPPPPNNTNPSSAPADTTNNNNIHSVQLPPEILDYVDGGRNPDVYKREFVEVVQRGNAVLNGKQEAFRSFSQIFAQELSGAMPEVKSQADRVLALLGEDEDGRENGGAGAGDGGEKSSGSGGRG